MSDLKSTRRRYALQTQIEEPIFRLEWSPFFGTRTYQQKLQHGSYIHRAQIVLCAMVDVSFFLCTL